MGIGEKVASIDVFLFAELQGTCYYISLSYLSGNCRPISCRVVALYNGHTRIEVVFGTIVVGYRKLGGYNIGFFEDCLSGR